MTNQDVPTLPDLQILGTREIKRAGQNQEETQHQEGNKIISAGKAAALEERPGRVKKN